MTLYDLAQRYVGVHELKGAATHPLIEWWLSLSGLPPAEPDETPWCSAFLNGMAWELRLPRSYSARARSWLRLGVPIRISDAEPANDVMIFARPSPGPGNFPGADVLDAPGHVGLYAGIEPSGPAQPSNQILVLGGNQSDGVSIARFPQMYLLGIRRIT